jgi:hypothetical protein
MASSGGDLQLIPKSFSHDDYRMAGAEASEIAFLFDLRAQCSVSANMI